MFVSESRGSASGANASSLNAKNGGDASASSGVAAQSAAAAAKPMPPRNDSSLSTQTSSSTTSSSAPSSSSGALSSSKGPLPPPPPPPLQLCIVINICHYLTPLAKLIIAAQPLDLQSLTSVASSCLSTAGESERDAFLALQQILAVLDSGKNEPINVFPFLDKFCRYIGVSFSDFEDMDIFLVWDYVVKLVTVVIPPLREVFLGRVSSSLSSPSSLSSSLSSLALDEQAWHALTTRCVHAQFSQNIESVDDFVALSLAALERDYHSDLDLYTHTNKTSLESVKYFNSVLLSRAPQILAFAIESPHLPSSLRFLDALSKNPSKVKPPSKITFPATLSLAPSSSLSSTTHSLASMEEKNVEGDSIEYELTAVVTLEGDQYEEQAYYRYVSASPSVDEESQWYKGSGATHDLVDGSRAIKDNFFQVSDQASKRVHPRLLIYTKRNVAQSLAQLQSYVTKAGQLRGKGDALFEAAETPEHYDEAKALYEDAIAVDDSLRAELQDRLHSLEQIERNQKATSYENQADLSLGKRRFKEACDLYKLAMRSAVPNSPIYQRIREKEDYMMRIISLEIANHLTEKGEDCLKNGQYVQSRENFAQALKLNPAYVHLQAIIAGIDKLITAQSSAQKVSDANAAMKLGRYKYANQLYVEAVQLVPEREASLRPVLDSLVVLMQGEDALNRQRQGLLALEDKKYLQAIALISEAIALLPQESVMEHGFFLCDRAQVHFEMKDYSAAIDDCNAALALRPDLAIALLRLGSAQFELSRFDDALAAYERAMRSDPSLSDQVKVKVRQVNTAKEVQQRKERERERERIKEEEQRRLEEKRAKIERERREKAERQREEQSEKAERTLMKEEERKTRLFLQKSLESSAAAAAVLGGKTSGGNGLADDTSRDRSDKETSKKESSSAAKDAKASKNKEKVEKDAQRLAERQAEKERARAEKERERERVKAEKAAKEREREREKEEELRRQREFAAEMERAASVLREAEREKEAERERARQERERIMAEKEKSRAEKERRAAEKAEKRRKEDKDKERERERERGGERGVSRGVAGTAGDAEFPTLAVTPSATTTSTASTPSGVTGCTPSVVSGGTSSAVPTKWAALLAPATPSVVPATSTVTTSVVVEEEREREREKAPLSQKTVSILKKPPAPSAPLPLSVPPSLSTQSSAAASPERERRRERESESEREREKERERESDEFAALLAHTHGHDALLLGSAGNGTSSGVLLPSPLRSLSAWDSLSATQSALSQSSLSQPADAFPSLSGLSLSPALSLSDADKTSLFEGLGVGSGGLGSGLGNLASGLGNLGSGLGSLGLSGGLGSGLSPPSFSRGASLSLFDPLHSLGSGDLFAGTSSGVAGGSGGGVGTSSGVSGAGGAERERDSLSAFSLSDFSLAGLGADRERDRESATSSRLDKILGLSVSSVMTDPFLFPGTSSGVLGGTSSGVGSGTSSGVVRDELWADPSPLSAKAAPFTLPPSLSSSLSLSLSAAPPALVRAGTASVAPLLSLQELHKTLEEVRVTDSVVFSALPRLGALSVALHHFAFDAAKGEWAEDALSLPETLAATLSLPELARRARCEVRIENCTVPQRPGSSHVSSNKLLVCSTRGTHALMDALLAMVAERETERDRDWAGNAALDRERERERERDAELIDSLLGGGPLNVSSHALASAGSSSVIGRKPSPGIRPNGAGLSLSASSLTTVSSAGTPAVVLGGVQQKRFLEIPVELIGLVIGHGGRKIKDLGADSGAKIQFRTSRHSEKEGKPGVLEIVGATEQVEKALALVRELLQSVGKEFKELSSAQASAATHGSTPSKTK